MSSIKINAGDVTRGDMLFVDPFEIVVKEDLRGRRTPPTEEAIIALAESMMDKTQLQAVQCRKIEDHRLQLNFGFTRMAAARLIREGFVGSDGQHQQDSKFKLKVVISNANDETAFINNIVENCHRNQTSDLDDAFNQDRLRERYGMSDSEIAKLYGDKSGQRVARLKTLLAVPSEIQEMVQSGEMSTPAVVELMQLPAEERTGAIEAAKAASTNGKVSAPAIRSQVREHHLRDEHTDAPPSSNGQATSTKPPKQKSKAMSLAEIRAFLEMQIDGATDGSDKHKLLSTMSLYFAGKRSLATMKKVLTDVVGN